MPVYSIFSMQSCMLWTRILIDVLSMLKWHFSGVGGINKTMTLKRKWRNSSTKVTNHEWIFRRTSRLQVDWNSFLVVGVWMTKQPHIIIPSLISIVSAQNSYVNNSANVLDRKSVGKSIHSVIHENMLRFLHRSISSTNSACWIFFDYFQMGFDGLFFGRADYQDYEQRNKTKTMELLWKASANLGTYALDLRNSVRHWFETKKL